MKEKKHSFIEDAESIQPTAVMDTAGAADTSDTEEQIKEVMQKYDNESNIREYKGIPRIVVRWMLIF